MAKLQAPPGTLDAKAGNARRRAEVIAVGRDLLESAGYEPIETPIFEATEVFSRTVGDSTDIVQKQMFTFEDQGGRSLTLRPEGTAPVARAYIEAGMHKDPQPVKLWYVGPFFRQERPQRGRYRQFAQIGAEAIGSEDPSLDAEVILLLHEYLQRIGAAGVRLKLSSLGNPETRRAYLDELKAYLRSRAGDLSDDVRNRIDLNPLRAFDANDSSTREVMREAPLLLEALAHDDAEHFARVREFLDDAGVPYDIDPTLVRGLDYYTRTVFEFESAELGAQSGIGGGGRYDLLIEQLGGQPTPGVGWAAGIERMAMASSESSEALPADVFVAVDGGDPRTAFRLVNELRGKGLRAQMEQAGRSLKGQLKQAGRVGADAVAILGPDSIRVRAGGSEVEVADIDAAVVAIESEEDPA
ncbi:MAG TPA: histidine--tRNA ligase [Thermoleophilaceae bacterium]